jgi:hypothetical protein
MKKFCIIPLAVAVTLLISCGKQQTEEERRAEIDREIQQRLDTEHQAEDRQKLAQEKADLDAREKALAEKETAAASTPTREPRARTERTERVAREIPENRGSKSYDMFYTKLERYGDWRETSDYGYVWQPREAQSRTWRPYTNGHWVYSDAGWTWVSEEPFGWAAYHYGRWVRLRNVGWVWVPGDEWAPAWVSWRTSNEYVGWAPLPPEARFDRRTGIHKWADNYYDIGPDQYSFVAQNEFGSQRVERAVVPVERNVTIVNQTTNVTNITYNNTTVVNQGPSYDEMRARSQEPIQRYTLERRSDVNEQSERSVVRGEVLEVTAPTISAQITQRPRTSRAPILQVTVERDWASSNQPAAQQARAKMKAEVAAPTDAPSKTFVKPVTTANAPSPAASEAAATSTATVPAEPTAPISQTPTERSRASVTPVASATPPPTATVTTTPRPRPAVSATAVPTAPTTESPSVRSTSTPAAPAATASPPPERAMQERQMGQGMKAQEQQRRREEKLTAEPRQQNERQNMRKSQALQYGSPAPAAPTPASLVAPTAPPSATSAPDTTTSSATEQFGPNARGKKQNKRERASQAESEASAAPSPEASAAALPTGNAFPPPADPNENKLKKQKHERGNVGETESTPSPTPSPALE